MSRRVPDFLTMFDRLLASPSVSCTEPEWDQGNRGVCELLAEWLQALGFRCEIQQMPSRADKVNLIAVLAVSGTVFGVGSNASVVRMPKVNPCQFSGVGTVHENVENVPMN